MADEKPAVAAAAGFAFGNVPIIFKDAALTKALADALARIPPDKQNTAFIRADPATGLEVGYARKFDKDGHAKVAIIAAISTTGKAGLAMEGSIDFAPEPEPED